MRMMAVLFVVVACITLSIAAVVVFAPSRRKASADGIERSLVWLALWLIPLAIMPTQANNNSIARACFLGAVAGQSIGGILLTIKMIRRHRRQNEPQGFFVIQTQRDDK